MKADLVKGINLPYYHKQHNAPKGPGTLMVQDIFPVCSITGLGRVYLYVVADAFSAFTFGFLHTSKVPEGAVAILHNEVLPFFREKGIVPYAIQTGSGQVFGGDEMHLYELYLALNNVKHFRLKGRIRSNSLISSFKKTVSSEFFQNALREKSYTDVDVLQQDFDAWLRRYNYERPRFDSRNLGRTAFDIIERWI